MKAPRFLVTGTDTDIGKTVFCAGLAGLLGARYWKPVQAGLEAPTDSDTVAALAGVPVVPEAYRLTLAASPHQAAAEEDIVIDPDSLVPPDGPLVIEGAGGLMVPLTRRGAVHRRLRALADSPDPLRANPAGHHQPHIAVHRGHPGRGPFRCTAWPSSAMPMTKAKKSSPKSAR